MPLPEEPVTEKPLPSAFLALLGCPLCADRSPLRLSEDDQYLVCEGQGHRFPVDPEFGFPDLRPPGEREVAPAAQEQEVSR
ncbi:MAG: hypothetical protein SFU56_18880 [Capsulimonadales bacterium]|nr:hypothetical protein [Capsulimonadales bacterium]